jgi:3-oxoacyl-[acyl-carrier protein] reductase
MRLISPAETAETPRPPARAAIVTGGGTGIGRATALLLADHGYNVTINYSRSREEAEETVMLLEAKGVKAQCLEADVASDCACRALIAACLAQHGRLDVLVNNAGTTCFVDHADLEGVTDEHWQRIFDVNVKGAFQCIRAARSALEQTGDGQVVNVSSIAGILGIGSSVPYAASKAAMNTMTVSLARALAPTIRVNAVAPGFIDSRWLRNALGDGFEETRQAEESRLPLRKVCLPEDIAEGILSLITGSKRVTGQILVIDGGKSIQG